MRSTLFLNVLSCSLFAVPALAGTHRTPCSSSFPMTVFADRTEEGGGLELALRVEDSQALSANALVRFEGVPLPDGTTVDLDLRRVGFDASELVVMVDGAPGRQEDGGSVMWAGRIEGDEDSDVFLAFSQYGSRGWIRRAGENFHLLAARGEARDWSMSTSRLVAESTLIAKGMKPPFSGDDALQVPGRPRIAPSSTSGGESHLGGPGTTLTCRIAFETDYQLFQVFGNLTAEQTYVSQLLGAANARYVEQVNTVLLPVFLAYYPNPNDPWTSPETGDSVDMLFEFQAAYAFNLPQGANLGHFLSGASLGGGVAWLDVLCDPEYGFAVSGNLGGDTPFPVTQGPSNWDFIVVTHEIGHNFGTPHTHDFCPPLDQCAPSGYFGQCQTQQVCISNGTLMGYCHLCPGGISNVYPYFHAQCVSVMRARAEATCLGPWCTGPVSFCPATANSTGQAALLGGSGSSSISANTFTLTADHLPPNKTVLFFYGDAQVQIAQAQGWRCAGGTLFRLKPALNSGSNVIAARAVNFAAPPAGSGPGKIMPGTQKVFQAYYRDPSMGNGGYNMTQAVRMPFCP